MASRRRAVRCAGRGVASISGIYRGEGICFGPIFISMTNPESSHQSQAQDNAPLHPAETFGVQLQMFWAKNRTAILIGCAVVLVAILGKGGYEMYVEQREAGIAKEYAEARTSEKLKVFTTVHSTHLLAGTAWLRLADEEYSAGRFAEAAANYAKALPLLKEFPLQGRARLGAAVSKLQAGQTADGIAALKLIADSASELKSLRAEAAYLLTSQAASSGNAADVQKYADMLDQIDGQSPWAQRAALLRATVAPESPALVPVPSK